MHACQKSREPVAPLGGRGRGDSFLISLFSIRSAALELGLFCFLDMEFGSRNPFKRRLWRRPEFCAIAFVFRKIDSRDPKTFCSDMCVNGGPGDEGARRGAAGAWHQVVHYLGELIRNFK